MKKLFPLFLVYFALLSLQLNAQVKTELGAGIGAFNYTGDLSQKYRLTNHRPAIQGFYKYNMSSAVNFRAAVTMGFIAGTDERPVDPFAVQRNENFSVFVFEVSTGFEYNFLDLKGKTQINFGSPYLFAGFGIAGFSGQAATTVEYSPVQPVIPFGFGVKYVLNPNWYLSMEFGARKLFFDHLDNVSTGDTRFKDYKYGNWYDNDFYYFIGFTATYSFYEIPCPVNPYR